MSSKKSTSRRYRSNGFRFLEAAACFCAAAALFTGCAKPRAAKPTPKPQRAYVQLQALAEAHPLAPSLRELEATAQRLRRGVGGTPAAPGELERITFAPVAPRRADPANERRNTEARRILLRDAEVNLTRYVAALRNTGRRIHEEKRAEWEGIAHARSAEREAEARRNIQNETRVAIAGRSEEALALRIRRNVARLNLDSNNIISVARDPLTNLPSKERLEEQVAELREREKNPPPDPKEPFFTSDEARLTKLLRDLQASLAKIRAANERDTLFNDGLIADAIATIRSDNAIWVEEQLAAMPLRDRGRAEWAVIRGELAILLRNLQQTERSTGANVARIAAQGAAELPPVRVPSTSAPVTGELLGRLSAERAAIRDAIRRDLLAAVRDAGLAHNVEPVFDSASNLPNRTDDFQQWIFGNVDAVALSNQSVTR
jgi:hypothetical protein